MKRVLFWLMDFINIIRCKRIMKKNRDKVFKYNIAVCAIAKNEESYIKEWIDYYNKIGVDHIFLIDNNDNRGLDQYLKSYIEDGFLTILPFNGIKAVQAQAYDYCCRKFCKDVKWLAFFDIDEFLELYSCNSIKDFLSQYDRYPSISINWKMYDSNGNIYRTSGSVRERFTRPSSVYNIEEINSTIKSIIRADVYNVIYDAAMTYVHRWSLPTYNECGERIEGCFHKPSHMNSALIHYYTKSYEEYKKRCSSGYALDLDVERIAYDGFFWINDDSMKTLVDEYERTNSNKV